MRAGNNATRNVVTNNETDGVQIEDDGATVSANTATDNGALGLVATNPVRGGGNRASGNGDPRQCVNVACLTTERQPPEAQPAHLERGDHPVLEVALSLAVVVLNDVAEQHVRAGR